MRGDFRIGHGFDAHRFKRGRKLVLGGIEIPHSAGLAGHSDADVLLHALINAILGALGEGDIGVHFPDSDARYKNISSAKLLEKVLQTMRRAKFSIVNGDVTVIAEKPRLAPHYEKIRRRLAQLLQTPAARINLKAATTEGMGWIGAEEGIAATAVVLLEARRKA
ncbi:MAG TPA: 2-C-methyl-D-erythritol 2,4-cyclodiphosphate synthase [Verrucomicrobiae bacterium]|nr:2-C-methyl-D-erythritol 2,4-cyclodiphosphate synthase [Verrucomicrobiae bacterium]